MTNQPDLNQLKETIHWQVAEAFSLGMVFMAKNYTNEWSKEKKDQIEKKILAECRQWALECVENDVIAHSVLGTEIDKAFVKGVNAAKQEIRDRINQK